MSAAVGSVPCPVCGAIRDLHFRGDTCLGCDACLRPLAMCIMCDCPVNPSELQERGAFDRLQGRGGIAVSLCPECYRHATDRLVRYAGPSEDPVPPLDDEPDDERDTLPAPPPAETQTMHAQESALRGHS